MLYIQRIRELREDKDYNQTYVAQLIHVDQTTYSNYELGKVRMPIECIVELARLYDVDLNFIIGVSDVRNEFPTK